VSGEILRGAMENQEEMRENAERRRNCDEKCREKRERRSFSVKQRRRRKMKAQGEASMAEAL